MTRPSEPAVELARRLKQLRTSHWPGVVVKQEQLKAAFGVSVPLISSWESLKNPVAPPEERLDTYALFFATQRSIDGPKPRLLKQAELTEVERSAYETLSGELKRLRASATGDAPPRSFLMPPLPDTAPINLGFWRFRDDQPVTIVCGKFPETYRGDHAYTHPDSPDYVALYTFTDLDAMIEVHGHIRAANPEVYVTFAPARGERKVTRDQLMNHLVVLGGVDFNPINEEVLRSLRVPVQQYKREADPVGAFQVSDGDQQRMHAPKLRETDEGQFLIEDVGHFVRGRNPFNQKRTVTICNGQYARGVYGAVRALTDIRKRDRNAAYIRQRFQSDETFSLLFRVPVIRGEVITPDWTQAGTVLHQWSGYTDDAQDS